MHDWQERASRLERWSRENENEANRYRIIATTDPARYAPAMKAARAHDEAAARYAKTAAGIRAKYSPTQSTEQ